MTLRQRQRDLIAALADPLLSVAAAAKVLDVTQDAVRHACAEGRLPHYQLDIDKAIKIPASAVLEYAGRTL